MIKKLIKTLVAKVHKLTQPTRPRKKIGRPLGSKDKVKRKSHTLSMARHQSWADSDKDVVMYPDGRLDTRNASAYVGLSEKTMAMMRCNGTGPKFVKRGRIFYFREDLDSWLNAGGRFTGTAQAQPRAKSYEESMALGEPAQKEIKSWVY